MDREALEHGLVRRLLDHIENRTTDLADGVLELPADVYSGACHDAEVEVLFRGQPLVLCLSGGLPGPGDVPGRGHVRHAGSADQGRGRAGAGAGERVPAPGRAPGRRVRPGQAAHLPLPRLDL